jgi:putative ABC transport system permease protein
MHRTLWIVLNKMRSVIHRADRERDMDEELRFHVEMEAAELRRAGVPADDALRRARALFGGIERTKDDARDGVGFALLDQLGQDLRYGLRQLRASPGFSLTTILTLSLGIGATTTMYTILSTVFTTNVPFPQPERIVHVAQGTIGSCLGCWRITTGNFMTVRAESRTLEDATLIAYRAAILRGTERTEIVNAASVTPAFFKLLETPAMLGRTIAPADSTTASATLVVLSEAFWRTRLGADRDVVGKTITLDATPFTVIGVIPDRLVFPQGTELWIPRILGPKDALDRKWTDDNMIARLRPGVTMQQAAAELASIASRLAASYPSEMHQTSFGLNTLDDWLVGGAAPPYRPMLAAVALVLLIACINLAGLLLTRLTARRKEIAVRAALGASGGRIGRQLLTETVLLTVMSGALGAALAAVAIHYLRNAMPAFITDTMPNWRVMHVDLGALLVAIATGVFTGVAIGIWPAARFARPALVDELKEGARVGTASGRVSRTRGGLVVIEIACAIMLLAAAGLVARSVHNMQTAAPGFRSDHVLTFRVDAPPTPAGTGRPVDSLQYERLAGRLEEMPGVAAAAPVFGLPYSHSASTNFFDVQGRASDSPLQHKSVQMIPAGTRYFAALDIPLLRGRVFTPNDRSGAPGVAVVDDVLAQKFFPSENPIGRVVVIDSLPWQIVGVVGTTRWGARGQTIAPSRGAIYRPFAQWPRRYVQLVVRTRDEPLSFAPAIERAVRAFDRDLAVTHVSTMDTLMREDLTPDTVLAWMMAGFAIAAVLISAIGLYGAISFGVARRMREFGIRRALGAESGALLILVIGEGARIAILGAILGLVGALAAARVMQAMLVDVSPTDPLTLAAVVVAMCGVAVAAAYVPARRATRVDPMVSLREE